MPLPEEAKGEENEREREREKNTSKVLVRQAAAFTNAPAPRASCRSQFPN